MFMDAMGFQEHRLDWTACHEAFIKEFEGTVEAYITGAGYSLQDFQSAAGDVIDATDHPKRFFVEALLSICEYRRFVDLMIGEAQGYLDGGAKK